MCGWSSRAGNFTSQAANPDAVAQFAKFERLSASPGTYKAFVSMNTMIDVRSIFSSVNSAGGLRDPGAAMATRGPLAVVGRL